MARMRAYLDFAAAHPRVYEAMFSMPSGLPFAADDTPEPLRRAFAGIHDVFPDADGTRAEVAWSALHGLATLQAGGRLRASHVQARLDLVHRMLTRPESPLMRTPIEILASLRFSPTASPTAPPSSAPSSCAPPSPRSMIAPSSNRSATSTASPIAASRGSAPAS